MKRLNDHLSLRFRVFVMTLMGVFMLCITDAYAGGSAYTDGRAYLRAGSPNNAGKVYVSTSNATPAASAYKPCNAVQTSESAAPSASAKVEGEKKTTTYHFWAVANAGYKFTGWYASNGALQSSGAAHISASVTSGTAGYSETHAYLDMHAAFIKIIQMGFVRPENGTYDITHAGEAVSNYASITVDGKVVLTAHPADGYKLRGWYTTTNGGVTKNYFAFGSTCEPNFTNNVTIGADFVPDDGKATFWIKGTNKIFDDLNAANSAASSGNIIVVVSDGVVGAGTYTIQSGVTLLIPYDETYNLMTTPKVVHYTSAGAAPALSAFRRLTLAEGAIINCSGNICIGGQQTAVNGGNPTSLPCGAAGVLDMSRGGTVNLQSGSTLYAWGFVKGQDMDQGNNTDASGVGVIHAASGATVWEDFQCGEWRGGSASSTIYSNKGSWKFFPFQSYSIQNVEVPVIYASGSNLQCHWAIFGNGSTSTVTFPLVANSNSLFKLASEGTLRKWYDPTTDRVCYELGGKTSLDELKLNVLGQSLYSSDYNLPIPANMHIILKSGNALTISNPMTMHAGSVVEVKSGATLHVNAKVYMYDADDWDTYCMYAYYYRTYKNLTSHYDRGTGTSKTNLEDATLIVDGTVNIASQCLYATAHGADVMGNGGGILKYGSLPVNTTMTQCKTLCDPVSVNIRSANLRNDNGSYTKGIASTIFKNVNGRWFTSAKSTEKANHTYDFTYIKSGDVYGTAGTNGRVYACYSKDKTGLALQDQWANIKAEGCDNWWTGIDDSHLYNWTLNNAWHQYIQTGSTVAEEGEEPIVTYAGSDGKVYQKQGCDIVVEGTMENCLYGTQALVNGAFVPVEKNTAPDEGYHKSDAATTYYLCFDGCVWHPATRDAENLYTVDGTKYIWYNNAWLAVTYDSTVKLYYSLSATNVRIYYEYIDPAWVLASPVAEVVTSAGTVQVYSLEDAKTKAKAGGTNVTIRLLKDMTISSPFTYDGTNNCGLDLNGYTLTGTVSSMIMVNNASATLIIKDQSGAGTGKILAQFSRSDNKVYGLNVTNGHLMINSGTVHIENTHTSQGACGVVVKDGQKFTMNGGTLEVVSKGESWGVSTNETTTSVVTVNGGTINTTTSSTTAASSGIYSLGGVITVNGGTITTGNITSTTVKGINLANAKSTLTIHSGTIEVSAKNTNYGIFVTAGSTATIEGGNITATTTTNQPQGIYSAGTTTINGGTITATAGTSDARGIFAADNTTTINAGATIVAKANTDARVIFYGSNTPTVVVNGGAFTATTLSGTNAYGIYADKGTGTVNDGTFTVTAKTTGAEGLHVETTNTPKLTVNGGKFMVKNSNGSADGAINNTAAAAANFKLTGGYYNIAPAGSYVIAGKSVKDVDGEKEQAIYNAGYLKKIAGNEYTVTWMDFKGKKTLATTQVENGKVPVWTGERPDYKDEEAEREWVGWSTKSWNRGTPYINGTTALPAIAGSDVTYYAYCNTIFADVTAGGSTTRHNDIYAAWKAAMAQKQATIRILSNLGSEAEPGNCRQLVFNPANANSIITLDLNGHTWSMGKEAAYNQAVFLKVSPSQANCKLIITDNSASGKGYLMNKHNYAGNLICADVTSGELILQGGEIRANNTSGTKYSVGVQVNGGAKFTMTGGKVYATDANTPRGINTTVNATTEISGGTVHAYATANNAYGILSYGTTTVGDSATIKAEAVGSGAYGTHTEGTLIINSGSFSAKAASNARALYAPNGGKITVENGSISAQVTSGNEAYCAYLNGANSEIVINGGSFTSTGTTTSDYVVGIRTVSKGSATVNGGTFTLNGGDNFTFGAFADGGTINLKGGEFSITQESGYNTDAVRVYPGGTCNISGGTFTVDKGQYAVRCFGGETTITGNPTFTARYGVDAGSWASAAGTAKVTIDGGTFICTEGFALNSTTHTSTNGTVTGDLTVWDGRFYSDKAYPISYSNDKIPYTKIRGGYYSYYSSSDVDSRLKPFVVSPSTVEAYDGKPYTYRVNTKYNVTFSVNGEKTVKQYNRNETPSFGSTPAINDGNTYEFIGWTPEIAPVTTDVTYTAVFKKWEAEIIMPNGTSKRYESFATAWTDAQQIQNCTIRVLSDVNSSERLTYNPAPPAGTTPEDEAYFTNATTTLDLNNHTLAYTGTTDRFVIVNKTGCVLKVADSSVAKGGVLKYEGNYNGSIYTVVSDAGDIVLESGKIFAKNTYEGKSSRAVTPRATTTFTMTGGTAEAHATTDARAIAQEGTPSVIVSGGKIIAKSYTISGDTVWGSTSYGICMEHGSLSISGNPILTSDASTSAFGVYVYSSDASFDINGGTFTTIAHNGSDSRTIYTNNNSVGNTIHSGTFKAIGLNGTNIHAVHTINSSVVDIKDGTFTSHANAGQSHCLFVQSGGTLNVSGGSFTAESDAPSNGNIEAVRIYTGGVVNISGGTFTSTGANNNIALRNLGGTATISGGTFTSGYWTIGVADAGSIGSVGDVTVNINGGTFISNSHRNIYASSNAGTKSVSVTVNGGYFHSANSEVVRKAENATIVLNGGKYNETSNTNHKNNILSYKGSTTELDNISDTVGGKTYVYELRTMFNISWRGGSSYTKDEQIYSGIVPTNNELVGKHFLRNDSAFYFTGWSPTPTYVTGDATYHAKGEYHVAKVKIGTGEWKIYDDFDEAWNDAMAATNANVYVTLLNNVTLDDYLVYKPAIANARTTLDLNNFKLTNNNAVYTIYVNKADAKLTITDTSTQKGGCIYKKKSGNTNIYGVYVYSGEVIMAGGKVYCENTLDDKSWHPAMGICGSTSNSTITITGGMVETSALIASYAVTGYGPVNISGGHMKATVTKYDNARALSQQMNTATITGGTFEAVATNQAKLAYAVVAGSYVSATGVEQTSTVNISGGRFIAQANNSAYAAYVAGAVLKVGERMHAVHSTLNISGGEFIAKGSDNDATAIIAANCDGARLFDDATPHNMIGEARAELNITGGTFLAEVKDGSDNLAGGDNVEAVRCFGTVNISGGTFTLNTDRGSGCRVFRGTLTISGNPLFNINTTTSARGIGVADWSQPAYCHKENNLAEAVINGGTFNVTATGSNVIGAYAARCVTNDGYGMSGKITINGGEFICKGGSNVNAVYRPEDQEATYGTATATLIINGGKFKSRTGTPANPTYNGNNLNSASKLNATGGYFVTESSLATHVADTCKVTTLADTDPEYANGYRYKIEPNYVAKVSKAEASDRFFCVMKDAFDYAKTQDNSTITLLRTVDDYVGSTLYYDPTTEISCTLDLNGFTFKGQATSVNPDRLLVINKSGCTFTIKDSSVGKTGKFSHEKSGANFAAVVYNGTVKLESGTVHCKNTGGNAQALRSTSQAAVIQVTGGKVHAESSANAYGVYSEGPATITGGLVLAEGADARGVQSQDANANVTINGYAVVKAIASSGTAHGLYVAGGGRLTISENACDTAICTTNAARGAYVGNNSQLTISGNAKIRANAGTSSYTVWAQGANAKATIEGGTITSYSSANNASITVYALSGATAHITGGTFYALCISGASNVSPIRTGADATMTIDGGTFYGGEHGTQFQAVSIRGGETTIKGGTFNADVGIRAMDYADAPTITGTLIVTGGTFNTTSQTIYVSSKNNNPNNAHSEVTIKGGKFKTTGSTIVQMGATPADTPASTLTITGGYFNEKSGTTFKNQIEQFVSDPYYCVRTTAADKAEVGNEYAYKVVADANTGFHADIVDVNNSAETLTLNVSMWGSSGWPYTINGVAYGKNSSSGQDKWREDDRTLILPYTGNAGDMFGIKVIAKNGMVVSDRLYTIPTAVTANTTLGDQQMVYVKRGATLTVAADKTVKNIYVAPGAKLVINSDKTLTADTVFLRTEAWESAEMEANGTLTGQICYTRIVKDESRYFQFGLPYDCPVSSVRLSSGHTIAYQGGWLLRSYSESSRADNGANGNNWQTLTDGTIRGGTGYEMFSAFGYYREFYFPVTPTDNTSVSVSRTGDNKAHSGWNIIVSPLMRAYRCAAVPEGPVASWLTEDGSYRQRPIEEIKPAIPFSYQAKESGTFSFGATMVAPAPRRVAATDEPTRIQWIQLEIADAEGNGDQAGIYSHPTRYDGTYQTGIDVAKQSFEASRALLYTAHAYGDMAFAGVADSLLERGIPVTVYSPAGQELTFSLRENDWLDRLAEVWLIDNETGTRTDLLRDDYSFLSKAGTTAGRFVIMGRFYAPGVATGIHDVQSDDVQGTKARKVLVDDKMYILINGRTYDATGKLVTNNK